MSFVARGAKNAFRNSIRTFAIVIILALTTGLALTMLLARQAVQNRIDSVKRSIGNTITVTPAGARGFQGDGNPLVTADVDQIKSTAHVTSVTSSLNDRLASTDTNLVSSITPGSIGRRANRGNPDNPNRPAGNFTPPIMITGTTDPTSTRVANSNQLKITSGTTIDALGSKNEALIGKDLAAKNNLSVGSTFTAYGKAITVRGIYDSGNTFANAGIIMPLASVQSLSAQPGSVSDIIVQTDSITNLSSTVADLQSKLGTKADVVSQQDTSSQALEPLENIKNITLYSLLGAVACAAIIIFLTMLMIVRERRREIGVFKAIGSSNAKIVIQFVSEAMVLTLLGSALGILAGAIFSNSVVKLLVATSGSTQMQAGRGGGFGRALATGGRSTLQSIHTIVGYNLVLYGLLGAVIIALVGSALPAYLISKIRPAEVMRSE